jgi:hypothetical protein
MIRQPHLHRARTAHVAVQVALALQRGELVRDARVNALNNLILDPLACLAGLFSRFMTCRCLGYSAQHRSADGLAPRDCRAVSTEQRRDERETGSCSPLPLTLLAQDTYSKCAVFPVEGLAPTCRLIWRSRRNHTRTTTIRSAFGRSGSSTNVFKSSRSLVSSTIGRSSPRAVAATTASMAHL